MYLFILLTHPNIGDSIGENIYIGVLTSLALSAFLFFADRRRDKKHIKKMQEAHNKTEVHNYITTLSEIAKQSDLKLVFNYPLTVQLLIERCNPKHYLSDSGRMAVAAELYSELISLDTKTNGDKRMVRHLRRLANEQLGVKLPAEDTYLILAKVFNPNNYLDENFDKEKLLACNKAISYIENNKADLRKLEQFAFKIGFIDI